jgi:hypothetical protein
MMTLPVRVFGAILRSHALLFVALLTMSATALADATTYLRFEVAAGIQAHVRLLEDGRIEVGSNRSAWRQQLPASTDEEGGSRLGHADYNFDGYQDLASSATLGQVNEAVAVYLYQPASGEFRELLAPAVPHINCEGFWSLVPDAASRTLSSSCRSGPMWYTDLYRYQGDTLYLYRSMRTPFIDLEPLSQQLAIDMPEQGDVLVVWTTWDTAVKPLEQALESGFAPPLVDAPLRGRGATVVVAKLPLYRLAGDATTARYLLKGDRVELLDEADGWLQLRYHNPTRGPVLGWIRASGQP